MDEDWFFKVEGYGDGIAGSGIDFNEFGAQLVFHLKDNPRVEGAIDDLVNDHALWFNTESSEDMPDEFMGHRPFVRDLIDDHRDVVPDGGIDINEESGLLRANEKGTAIGGWHDAFYGDWDYLILHVY